MLRLTRAVNEPYDYILYASISALGFAFVENVGYIGAGELYNINARAFMATVAHMTFSSTIGYGMMLGRYREGYNKVLMFIVFFILAATMHGFYDFWLMNSWAADYSWVTTIYFILSIHFWFIFKNNALNISNFYDSKLIIKNDRLKFYLIISLISILMLSYLFNSYTQGPLYGVINLLRGIAFFGFFILYLSFSFSRYEIIHGYLAPFNIPFNFLLPRLKSMSDFSGMPLSIMLAKRFRLSIKYEELAKDLPLEGVLVNRLVISGNLECYLMKLDTPINVSGVINDRVVLRPKRIFRRIGDPGNILIYLMLIPSEETLDKTLHFKMAGWALSRKIVPELDDD